MYLDRTWICRRFLPILFLAEIISPILRGRDIKRYGYNWAGLYLIWIPWHFPLHLDSSIQGVSEKAEIAFKLQYPSVYQHLLQYKDKLSARNKAETGIRYEWYALQRWGANYWDVLFQMFYFSNLHFGNYPESHCVFVYLQ